MRSLWRAIDPIHDKNLLVVLFERNRELAIPEVGIQCSFNCQKQHHIFIVVISQISDDVGLSQLKYLQTFLMNNKEHVTIVDNSDIPSRVKEVLGERSQPLLDLLQLFVLTCIEELQ
jgi:hypothetical protein